MASPLLFTALPFLLMLSGIALLPTLAPHWWHRPRNQLLFTLAISIPTALLTVLWIPDGWHLLQHNLEEYITLVLFLSALFIITACMFFEGSFSGRPLANALLLLFGSVIASLVGTTGACMLLIRPLMDSVSHRTHQFHIIVFFIVMVANVGGCLLPIGDPPLFLGYLYGVPFLWTLHLFPYWLFAVLGLLAIFIVIDTILFKDEHRPVEPMRWKIQGSRNVLFLLAVVAAVALLHDFFLRLVAFASLAALAWVTTSPDIPRANKFSLHPIQEVAILFLGIFVTLTPVNFLLKHYGELLPITEPWHFFWGTGLLSAFLDNTPTYAVFFQLAKSHELAPEIAGLSEVNLTAVSLGAVFFGALTYIGNAPNLMVKAIAEDGGIKMPSFFSFFFWASLALLPILIVISWFGF